MTGRLPRVSGVIAMVDTADQGYWWGLSAWGGPVTASAPIASNTVRAVQFVLPYRLIIGRLAMEITTLSVGGALGVGIYSADGQTRLVTSEAISTTTTGVKSVILGTLVTLEPGAYWFGYTADNTVIRVAVVNHAAQAANILNARTVKKHCVAGNGPDSPGVLPSALGTLTTAVTVFTPILVVFEP